MIGVPFLNPDDQPPCHGHHTLFWEDEHIPDPAQTQADAIKQLCDGCPFQADCADWGIRHERHGWWGGLSEVERKTIRARRGIRLQPPQKPSSVDWVTSMRNANERTVRGRMYVRNQRDEATRRLRELHWNVGKAGRP